MNKPFKGLSEIPRKGRSRGGRCANLSQIACQICTKLLVFRFIHHRKGAQNCRKSATNSKNQSRTFFCKRPFSNVPFLKFLRLSKHYPGIDPGLSPHSPSSPWRFCLCVTFWESRTTNGEFGAPRSKRGQMHVSQGAQSETRKSCKRTSCTNFIGPCVPTNL